MRTNPDTCQHWLAHDVVTDGVTVTFVCASCESTLSPEYLNEYEWNYDIDHNIWRRYPKRKNRGGIVVDGLYVPEIGLHGIKNFKFGQVLNSRAERPQEPAEYDDRFEGFDRDMLQAWGRDQGITPVRKPHRGAN